MTERLDLYGDVTQPRQGRKPVIWLTTAVERKPDYFLRKPSAAQTRRGSTTTAAMHRAHALADRLGL